MAEMFDRRGVLTLGLGSAILAGCGRPQGPRRATRKRSVKLEDGSLYADIIVYGATPAGIAAACTAAQEGASVVLIGGWRERHPGGMMAGGLGTTDFIDSRAYGGFPVDSLKTLHALSPGADPDNKWSFDPRYAPGHFQALLDRAGVPFLRSGGIVAADVSNRRIRRIVTARGNSAYGQYFIDASYEGDILPRAGISYRVGRDSIGPGNPKDGVTPPYSDPALPAISPFRTEGDESSGLLAGVEIFDPAMRGKPDRKTQAYTFRMLLTKDARQRIDFGSAPPAGYDRQTYEPHIRYLWALQQSGQTYGKDWSFEQTFFKADLVADGIYDVNGNRDYTFDAIGRGHDYIESGYADREKIWKDHEAYIRGLFFAFGWEQDQRIPGAFQREVRSWGLAQGHFQDPFAGDAPGWPYQLYIREGRRLNNGLDWSDSDMSAPDNTARLADQTVAMATYNEDCHPVRRVAYRDTAGGWRLGVEGALYEVTGGDDYRSPLPFRIMLPAREECENLLTPISVAASHQAYGSIRMEPTFMALGQAAGLATALAASQAEPIFLGDLDLRLLQARLRAIGGVVDERSAVSVAAIRVLWTLRETWLSLAQR